MNPESHRRSHIFFFIFIMSLLLAGQADAQSSGDGLRLVGTIDGRKLAGAVFQDTTGKQTFFPLHEKLPDGSRIVKIRDDSIVLKDENGNLFEMYFSRDTKTVATGQTTGHQSVAPTPPRPQTTKSDEKQREAIRRRRHLAHSEE